MKEIAPHAICYPAPAKLNLDLRITGRRDDGYHNLESIFCLIDLCDDIWLAPRLDGLIKLHNPAEGLQPEQDLTYRAAALLKPFSANPNVMGVDIWQTKRIPSGGGLGGGSSDAATVLLVLNQLWQCHLSTPELINLGVQLGADVPFFLFGRNAFAQGIGENLQEIFLPKQWYVIIKPSVHVSTAAIFSHKNLTRDSKPSIMPTFQTLQPFRNDMQAVVLELFTEVKQALHILEQLAGNAQMTGSGACIFASFENEDLADSVYKQVHGNKLFSVWKAKQLVEHPLKNKF